MKHICHRLLHDDKFLEDKINLPLLVRLRDINARSKSSEGQEKFSDDDLLVSLLQDLTGIRIGYPPELSGDDNKTARSKRPSSPPNARSPGGAPARSASVCCVACRMELRSRHRAPFTRSWTAMAWWRE